MLYKYIVSIKHYNNFKKSIFMFYNLHLVLKVFDSAL